MKNFIKIFAVVFIVMITAVFGYAQYPNVIPPTHDSSLNRHLDPATTNFKNVKIFEFQVRGGESHQIEDVLNISKTWIRFDTLSSFNYRKISYIYYVANTSWGWYQFKDLMVEKIDYQPCGNLCPNWVVVNQDLELSPIPLAYKYYNLEIWCSIDTIGITLGDTLRVSAMVRISGPKMPNQDWEISQQNNIFGKKIVSNLDESSKPEIKIFPNPFSDYIVIDGSFKKVTIKNTIGQTIYEGTEKNIETSFFNSGMYFIYLDNNNLPKKIIKN